MPSTADDDAPGSLRAALDLLCGRLAPLQAGDIQIDDDGRVRPRSDDGPIRFGFAYRGVNYQAELTTDPTARVSLTADLGKLPYSAELGPGRRLARRIVEASAGLPRGRIHLSAAQDLCLKAELQPPPPLTPASIMATVGALLLDFKPYLDLLGRALEPPPRRAPIPPEPPAA